MSLLVSTFGNRTTASSISTDLRQAPLISDRNRSLMSKKIERTLASLLLALVTSGGSSKIH